MKNRIGFIGAGLLALILVFSGCSNPLGEQPASPEAGSGGKLVIQLGDAGARTLAPAAAAIDRYRVVLEKAADTLSPAKVIEDADAVPLADLALVRTVEPGTWTVKVFGLRDIVGGAVIVANGTTDVEVREGETASAQIVMKPYEDDKRPGTFQYAVALPTASDFDYALAELRLTPVSSGPNDAEPSPVIINLLLKRDGGTTLSEGNLELPAGQYEMELELVSTRQVDGTPLKVVRKETVYIYPDLTTSTSELELDTITIADNFDAEVYLAGWIDPDYSYIPSSTSTVEVQLRRYNTANTVEDSVTAEVSLQSGTYYWDFGHVPSELIGGSENAGEAWVRYLARGANGALLFTSDWQSVDVDIQGSNTVLLYGIPVAQGVSAARNSSSSSYPFRVTVSWQYIPYSYSARYINIYRDDELVGHVDRYYSYGSSVTSYDDNTAGVGPYTYQVKVANYNGFEGAGSNTSVVPRLQGRTLTPGQSFSGTLAYGQVEYFTYTVPTSGRYSIQKTTGSSYIYANIVVNSNSASGNVSSWNQYLNEGDQVMVAVRNTSNYSSQNYAFSFQQVIIPVAQNVSAARTPTQSYPFQVTVYWDPIASDSTTAYYIWIYRDDALVTSVYNSGQGAYTDTTAGVADHTYYVRVSGVSQDQGALSNIASVPSLSPDISGYLTPGNSINGNISYYGEVFYYSYTVQNPGTYYLQDNSAYGYIDVRITVAVNNDSPTEEDYFWSRYLYAGDRVTVAISPSTTNNTGSYWVSFNRN